MIRSAAPCLAALALLAAAPRAAADDVADAKGRFRKGAELYRAGKWREAIAEFEAAYRLKPHGAIHFNVAQCRERLSEWPGALRAYNDYLREVPDAKDRAVVRASMAKIEERLAAAGVQALLVYSDPPGAEVRLDGRPRGVTPFHIVLPPGSYALALSLEGYEPVKQDVAIPPRTSRVVDPVLRPATPPPAAAAIAPSRAAERPGVPPAAATPPPGSRTAPHGTAPDLAVKPQPPAPVARPAPEQPRAKRRVYTWIAAGTAVVAAAAGAYYGMAADRDADAIDGIANDGDRARRTARDAESKARTANILYAASGAAAAAGVTLFFVEKRF